MSNAATVDDFVGFTPCHHEPVYDLSDVRWKTGERTSSRYTGDGHRSCQACGDPLDGRLLSLGDIIAGNNWGPWEALSFILKADDSLLALPVIQEAIENSFADTREDADAKWCELTDLDYKILDAMERYGGGFVQAFAVAYRKADSANRALLQPVLEKYRPAYKRAIDAMAQRENTR